MIDKYNIPIQYKHTKKIRYTLYLDIKWWCIEEFNNDGDLMCAINN
jgi:hypothetical protein